MKKMNTYKATIVLAAAGLMTFMAFGATYAATSSSDSSYQKAVKNPANWVEYNRGWRSWRYSPLSQINKADIAHLHVAWIHQTGDITNGLLSTPLVKNGVMYYVGADDNVFALNAATGVPIWHFQPDLKGIANASFYAHQIRNITLGHGFVYLGTLDGRVVAIDQKTGKKVWSTKYLVDLKTNRGSVFSSTPVLAGDYLVGGVTGGDQATRGRIFGINALTGKLEWTFYTTKKDPKSWPGDSWKVGGAAAWNVGSYNPKTDTIYIGVGNTAPDFFGNERNGNNLYAASLLALDPKDGHIKWYRQEVPHDLADQDSVYEAVVIDHGQGKNRHEYIVHLNKGGFVYVMRADSGKLFNVWPFAQNINWVKSINPKTGAMTGRVGDYPMNKVTVVCPQLFGVRTFTPGAYSPQTKLWYSNAMEACEELEPSSSAPTAGIAALYLGESKLKLIPPPGKPASARLQASDPFTGKVKWTVSYKSPALGAVLATAGGLVFNGLADGYVHAYDAETGKNLWKFNVGSGTHGGIVSYAVDGKQYISVASGQGSLAPGFLAGVWPDLGKATAGAAVITFTLSK